MIRVEIKPELSSWARERAGYDLNALSHRFPLGFAKLETFKKFGTQPGSGGVMAYLLDANVFILRQQSYKAGDEGSGYNFSHAESQTKRLRQVSVRGLGPDAA